MKTNNAQGGQAMSAAERLQSLEGLESPFASPAGSIFTAAGGSGLAGRLLPDPAQPSKAKASLLKKEPAKGQRDGNAAADGMHGKKSPAGETGQSSKNQAVAKSDAKNTKAVQGGFGKADASASAMDDFLKHSLYGKMQGSPELTEYGSVGSRSTGRFFGEDDEDFGPRSSKYIENGWDEQAAFGGSEEDADGEFDDEESWGEYGSGAYGAQGYERHFSMDLTSALREALLSKREPAWCHAARLVAMNALDSKHPVFHASSLMQTFFARKIRIPDSALSIIWDQLGREREANPYAHDWRTKRGNKDLTWAWKEIEKAAARYEGFEPQL